jgi:uncharacterized protein YpmB
MRFVALSVGIAASVCVQARGAADEKKIDLAKVPAVVRQAAEKAAPGVKFTAASKETEKGKTTYELEGRNAQDREVTVEVTAAGKVLEVETEIELNEVPKVVSNALKAKMPGFQAIEASTIHKDGKLVWYGFEGKNAKGEELDVLVSPDGKTVKEDDDDN